MEFGKMITTTLYARQQESQMYRTVFWILWEREGGMIWENGIKTCIISYKKRMASPGSMQDTGSLGLVHWDDPEGWYGREVRGGFRMGNTCTPVTDACWCMAKLIQYCKVKKKKRKSYALAMVVHTWEGSQNNGYFPWEARGLSLTSGDTTLKTAQKSEVPQTPDLKPLGNMIPPRTTTKLQEMKNLLVNSLSLKPVQTPIWEVHRL